jgi:hypothetical protein
VIAAAKGDMQSAVCLSIVGERAASGEEAGVLAAADARPDDFRAGMYLRRIIHEEADAIIAAAALSRGGR